MQFVFVRVISVVTASLIPLPHSRRADSCANAGGDERAGTHGVCKSGCRT